MLDVNVAYISVQPWYVDFESFSHDATKVFVLQACLTWKGCQFVYTVFVKYTGNYDYAVA